MGEKWKRFAEAVRKSSWKVRLSALVMGSGQFLYGRRIKGLIYLFLEISIVYYFISRGAADIVGFFTLGTVKGDAWLGIKGDDSIVMRLMGIFAWVVLAVVLCLYISN